MALNKNQRYTLLKLNNKINSMEEVNSKILSREHKAHLNAKNADFDENNEETYLLYKWGKKDEEEEFDLDDGSTVTYVKAIASCEYSKRKIRKSDGDLLPKDKRINIQETDVLFINFKEDFYAIVYTFNLYELGRVKKLIGNGNTEPLDSEYQVFPDMFTWLFYEYSQDSSIDNSLEVGGITGFTGNVMSEENTIKGDSEEAPDLMVTKAFLANKNDITSMKLDINVDSCTTSFYICENSNSGDELHVKALRGSITTEDNFQNEETIYRFMPVYIYFCLIPKIYKAYKKEKSDFEARKKGPFLFQLGIEVIKQIMARNNISIDDIK